MLMAISPVNLTRISTTLQYQSTLGNLQQSQQSAFISQNHISSGRNFVTISEDPTGSSRVLELTSVLEQQSQFLRNLQHADDVLSSADYAVGEITPLINEATTIALQNIDSITSAAERESAAELIASIRTQLMMVGNRQLEGRYIFAGQETTTVPFVEALGGVAYLGDVGEMSVRIDRHESVVINVPGSELFGALSSRIASSADLAPAVTEETRISDLSDVDTDLIRSGRLVIREAGQVAFAVDLSGADTLGDVVTRINDAATAAGSPVTAGLTSTGLEIDPGNATITVGDTGTGQVAEALGIRTATETTDVITGDPLSPRVTRLTAIADLAGGAGQTEGEGLDLTSGLVITNGSKSVTIDLSTAETVQDVINIINNAGVYVHARINDDGTAIDLFNQVSGTSLTVAENGGTTAADLGLRTFERATTLDELNNGHGIPIVEGEDDLEITARDGSSFTVNLDGAFTVGDVIDLINAAAEEAGSTVSADLAEVGNGIRITDSGGGDQSLSVADYGLSTAASALGLAGSADADVGEWVGEDVNPTRTEGVFDVLVELERALREDETAAISAAADRLDGLTLEVTRIHGVVGARAEGVQDELTQMGDAAATTEMLISEVQDLDYTEAVTQLMAAQTQLQGTLQTATQLLNQSLLDYLR